MLCTSDCQLDERRQCDLVGKWRTHLQGQEMVVPVARQVGNVNSDIACRTQTKVRDFSAGCAM
jgi:hypothetical protein